ncbi:MAG: protein phosphatase 2C domain-containing protein [Planctomycetales bacterium]|nr:protein phosphatase 2C domain-containing protein [Planctomycetales bacterium]MCA9225374.1 protein phosphatase 2C domain-containing protein [Planctomycetales bacterium]
MSVATPANRWLYFEQEMQRAEVCALGGGRSAVFSCRSPEKSPPNQDAAAVIPCGERSAVLIVADGMGGGLSGEKAARQAILSVQAAVLASLERGGGLRAGILDGLEAANREVLRIGGGGAATTFAAVEIDDGVARPYHVGDSMILIIGGRGKLKLQTVSHSPVGYAVEAGVLDETDAMHHAQRHLVSNVVGSPEMRIEIGPSVELAARDTVLIASDGLFDNLHIPEIVELARKGRIGGCAQQLAEQASRRMRESTNGTPSKPDDLTLLLFRLASARKPRTARSRTGQTSSAVTTNATVAATNATEATEATSAAVDSVAVDSVAEAAIGSAEHVESFERPASAEQESSSTSADNEPKTYSG